MSFFCASRPSVPSYRISQNFLTATRTIVQLLNQMNLTAHDVVWEIGAGKGHITRQLMLRCAKVTAIEIDPILFEKLPERIGHAANVRLLCGDFLMARLPGHGAYKVVSNLPFNQTTAIIKKLTAAPNPPTDCWLIMEKGAAKRFCGLPEDSLQSLLLKPFFHTRYVCMLRREEFHPMPAVDAALIHIKLRENLDIPLTQRAAYEAFLRRMHEGSQHAAGRRKVQHLLRQANAPQPDSDSLRYVQWLALFRSGLR